MDIGDYFDDLEAHEGCCQWLYCDSRGFVTVGIGNLVASADAAKAYPFVHRDTNAWATDDEKAAGWQTIKDAFDATKSAAFYAGKCDLRLALDYVKSLVSTRLANEFIPGLVRLCPQFSTFPSSCPARPRRHGVQPRRAWAWNVPPHARSLQRGRLGHGGEAVPPRDVPGLAKYMDLSVLHRRRGSHAGPNIMTIIRFESYPALHATGVPLGRVVVNPRACAIRAGQGARFDASARSF
jgi:hypothetical protein